MILKVGPHNHFKTSLPDHLLLILVVHCPCLFLRIFNNINSRFAADIRIQNLNHATTLFKLPIMPETSLTPAPSSVSPSSSISSDYFEFGITKTRDRQSPDPGSDSISGPYFKAFPLPHNQSIILQELYQAIDDHDVSCYSPITTPTSSMSVEDGDRVSDDGHLHAAAVSFTSLPHMGNHQDSLLTYDPSPS